jgi:hypothetical protein
MPRLLRWCLPCCAVLAIAWIGSRAPAKYEVRLSVTGYSGTISSPDCDAMVNLQGYDSLMGTLTGVEPTSQTDDDVIYTGTLKRVTKMDYCETRKAPTVDQVKLCVASLTGRATMQAELTVYGDEGEGAWLKAKPVGKADTLEVRGNCETADMNTIRAEYPGGQSAGSPDGQPIAEGDSTKFIVNGIPKLRVGYHPVNRPETAWGLRVVRAVP